LKLPELRCGHKEERKRRKVQEISEKKEKDKKAKLQLAELDASEVLEKVNASSRTDELLEKIVQQNDVLVKQNNDLKEKVCDIEQQNHELKEMVTEFARNPKLLVLVDKLYPIQSLKEIDLKMTVFRPVLEILDNELPEYANLSGIIVI
jgi:cell division protein FtsB